MPGWTDRGSYLRLRGPPGGRADRTMFRLDYLHRRGDQLSGGSTFASNVRGISNIINFGVVLERRQDGFPFGIDTLLNFQYHQFPANSTVMDSTPKRRSRGRPKSGKMGFMVRMPPDAHEALKRIAQNNGLSVGDWLASLHGVETRSSDNVRNGDELDIEWERRKFVAVASELRRLLEMLVESVDLEPRIADDNAAIGAMAAFERERRKLKKMLDRELPGRFQD